jgi:hypothetical protein
VVSLIQKRELSAWLFQETWKDSSLLDIMAILTDKSIGRPEKPCLSGNRRKMGIMTGGTLKVVDIA